MISPKMTITWLALVFALASYGQPEIKFDSTLHHLGFFPPHASYKHPIVIYNTGDEPLIITAALANAGSDVGSFNRKPIPPGGQDTIYFSLKTYGHPSRYRRSMTIRSNTENRVVHFIYYVKEQDPEESKLAVYELGNNNIQLYLHGEFQTKNDHPVLHIEERINYEYKPMYKISPIQDSSTIQYSNYSNCVIPVDLNNLEWNEQINELTPGWYRVYAILADGRKIYSVGFGVK